MKRRSYKELDSRIKKALEKFGEEGASIREISQKAEVNWHTTKRILGKFEDLGLVEKIVDHKRLKLYRLKD